MSDNLHYYLAFSHFLGIGPVRLSNLIQRFKSVKKAYEADKQELSEVLGSKIAERFNFFRNSFDPVSKLTELRNKQISVLSQGNKNYPKTLLNIPDPPICLYIRGDIQLVDFENSYFIAIVGTRQPTSYGQQIARKFALELSALDFTTVSGMAIGIDTIVHRSSLDNKKQTIAILGCGVDIVYPSVNFNLYNSIIQSNGLAISEFPPGETVKPGLFIVRNRIISGLSKGVIVIEGQKDSGSLITARYAVNQGKEVFAPPSPITSIMSEAPNILLKQGAKLITSVEDVLEEFNLKIKSTAKEDNSIKFTDKERLIYTLIENQPKTFDEIAIELKISTSETSQILSLLEIKGVVEKNSEGKYQTKP